MTDTVEKTCEQANCHLPGVREEKRDDGERLVSIRLRHSGEYHTKKIPLAEKVVRLIKQDKDFATYFQKLLAS